MPVRMASQDDVAEICAMVQELADFERAGDEVELDPDRLRTDMFGPDPVVHALIAHPEGQPDTAAGMAVWFRTYGTWVGRSGIWLEDLYIRPAYRRLGLGRSC